MGRKVRVTTKCGEIHHYEYNQEVKSVEIIESPKPYRMSEQNDGHWHILSPDGFYVVANIYLDEGKIQTLKSGGGDKLEINRE